jgi:hypothetical protein
MEPHLDYYFCVVSIYDNRIIYEKSKCHYNTSKKSSFDKHLTTAKHQLVTFGNAEVALNDSHLYSCEKCNKDFKSRRGLWYHKKNVTRCNKMSLRMIL